MSAYLIILQLNIFFYCTKFLYFRVLLALNSFKFFFFKNRKICKLRINCFIRLSIDDSIIIEESIIDRSLVGFFVGPLPAVKRNLIPASFQIKLHHLRLQFHNSKPSINKLRWPPKSPRKTSTCVVRRRAIK